MFAVCMFVFACFMLYGVRVRITDKDSELRPEFVFIILPTTRVFNKRICLPTKNLYENKKYVGT